jgi:hypothetical protein
MLNGKTERNEPYQISSMYESLALILARKLRFHVAFDGYYDRMTAQ